MSSQYSRVNDSRTRLVEYLNASQMSQPPPGRKVLDDPSVENVNAAACVAKTLRIGTQIIASQVRKEKQCPIHDTRCQDA
jgi:hypothetical protein